MTEDDSAATDESTEDSVSTDLSVLDGTGAELTVDTHDYGGPNTEVYNQESDALHERQNVNDSADDVDPRRLTKQPDADEVRFYYRNHPLGSPLVEKPIKDAFKHGFSVENDPTGDAEDFLEDYHTEAIQARIKARRDGFSVLLFQFEDTGAVTDSPRDSGVDVRGMEGYELLTIDDLDDGLTDSQVAEYVGYEEHQLRILDQGIVVVSDITSPDHHEIVGYIYDIPATKDPHPDEAVNARFIHADRCQHFVHNGNVDGPVNSYWVGHATGHPILAQCFQELKALYKSNWAIGQTTFRYTSPLHVIETPDSRAVDSDHMAELNKQTQNINSASTITLPPGHEMDDITSDGELDPRQYIEPLIDQISACTEFTKSVLIGTQTGTVSGSETDIKNYFNHVERYRRNTFETKAREAARMVFRADRRLMPSFALGFQFEWEPLFKLDQLDKMEAMSRSVQTVTNATDNYVLSIEEGRSILEEQWSRLDIDVDLSELPDESDWDLLDRVNASQQGTSITPQENEMEGNPRVGQNGGGREQGQTSDPDTPNSA